MYQSSVKSRRNKTKQKQPTRNTLRESGLTWCLDRKEEESSSLSRYRNKASLHHGAVSTLQLGTVLPRMSPPSSAEPSHPLHIPPALRSTRRSLDPLPFLLLSPSPSLSPPFPLRNKTPRIIKGREHTSPNTHFTASWQNGALKKVTAVSGSLFPGHQGQTVLTAFPYSNVRRH